MTLLGLGAAAPTALGEEILPALCANFEPLGPNNLEACVGPVNLGTVPDCATTSETCLSLTLLCVTNNGSPVISAACIFRSTASTENTVNSAVNTVNDAISEVLSPVQVNVTFGPKTPMTVVVPFASVTTTPVPVAGYVDRYAFFGGSVVLPCVVLTAAGSSNTCALAGGTFVNRVLTILDTTAPVPTGAIPGTTPVTVNQCTHKVTVLAAGFGLNQFPVTVLC